MNIRTITWCVTVLLLSFSLSIHAETAATDAKFQQCKAYVDDVVKSFSQADEEQKPCWNPNAPPFSIDEDTGRYTTTSWASKPDRKKPNSIVQICKNSGIAGYIKLSGGSSQITFESTFRIEFTLNTDAFSRASQLVITTFSSSQCKNCKSFSDRAAVPKDAKFVTTVDLGTNAIGECYIARHTEDTLFKSIIESNERKLKVDVETCLKFLNLVSSHVDENSILYKNLLPKDRIIDPLLVDLGAGEKNPFSALKGMCDHYKGSIAIKKSDGDKDLVSKIQR